MGSPDQQRRSELGAFLRSRRERISPDQVGLPVAGRRRTPGLRREEIAMLAGVGVTWYTWLEQGRDINVSVQVLDSIARTLTLDPHERSHLYTLGNVPLGATETECQHLPAATQTILDQMEPYPAFVANSKMDVLAFNRAYDYLYGDNISALPQEDRNTMWLIFTNPAWRAGIPNLRNALAGTVGRYRTAMGKHVGEPGWRCLVQRLKSVSPEFTELWEKNFVTPSRNLLKEVVNPHVGSLRVDYTYLWLDEHAGSRMVTYTPADERTRQRMLRMSEVLDQRFAAVAS